jgi:hypothetical protein
VKMSTMTVGDNQMTVGDNQMTVGKNVKDCGLNSAPTPCDGLAKQALQVQKDHTANKRRLTQNEAGTKRTDLRCFSMRLTMRASYLSPVVLSLLFRLG